jgi:hypothetical protein
VNFPKRFPSIQQLAPVYAVIVVVIYSWSLLHFFWQLPSWMYFSTVGEIAVFYSYTIFFNFIESILVLIPLILFSIILPSKWFFARFISMGTLLTLFGLGYMMYFTSKLNVDTFPLELVYQTPLIAIIILAIVFLIDRLGFLNKAIEELANRFTVFLYISIPVSLLSLLTILIRNIF